MLWYEHDRKSLTMINIFLLNYKYAKYCIEVNNKCVINISLVRKYFYTTLKILNTYIRRF